MYHKEEKHGRKEQIYDQMGRNSRYNCVRWARILQNRAVIVGEYSSESEERKPKLVMLRSF